MCELSVDNIYVNKDQIDDVLILNFEKAKIFDKISFS